MMHGIASVGVILLLLVLGVNPHVSAALAAAFYIGREHAQAEHRIISERYGARIHAPWYAGFLPAAWNRKSALDAAVPAAIAVAVWVLA